MLLLLSLLLYRQVVFDVCCIDLDRPRDRLPVNKIEQIIIGPSTPSEVRSQEHANAADYTIPGTGYMVPV